MSLVGYDPVLVDALRRRMRSAADELAAIRSSDPAAAGAVTAAAAVRQLLEWTWMPAIGDLLVVDPLGRPGSGAGPSSMWSSIGSSMWSSIWPATGATGPTPTNGPACAIPDEMVVRRLDELADARAVLIASHGPHPEDPEAAAELAAIDARIAAVARAYVTGIPRTGHAPLYPRALLEASPYAAALALRAVHDQLEPRTLAAIGLMIVRRWHANSDHRTGWLDAQFFGPNAADILFEVLAQHPDAATWFLRRAQPREVLDATASIDPVTALLVAGTAPGQIDETTAGQLLVPLVRWARDHDPLWPEDHPLQDTPVAFAAALTPWMATLGPRADRWGWDRDEGEDTLDWVLDHPGGAQAIHDALATWKERIAETGFVDADGRIAGRALHDLAETLEMIEGAFHDARIESIERTAFMIDLAFTVAGMVISAAVPGGPATGRAVDAGLAFATPAVKATLERLGIIPSPERERAAAQADLQRASTTTLVIALTATVSTFVDRGELPADALDALELDEVDMDDPEAVHARLVAYVDTFAPVAAPATTNALFAVIGAFDDDA